MNPATMLRNTAFALALIAPVVARAEIDPKCAGLPKPSDYDEQTQGDYLQNFFALSTTYSPIHAPIPHEPGHGAIGVDFLVLPPLGCDKRYVLEWTKTEETNITPVAPRPRVTFAFDGPGELVPYAGFAYVPPVTLFGTRNVIVSGEIGAGYAFGDFQVGGRFHATMQKTVADIATGFNATDPVVLDLFVSSTFGGDLLAGYDLGSVTPYVAVGATDASTFFLVGDDLVVSNNLHPYAGLTFSAGVDALLVKHLRLAGEFYGAPGGYSRPDDTASQLTPGSRYGHLYTARIRVAYEL